MIDPQEYFLALHRSHEEKIAHIFEIYERNSSKPTRWTSTICCSKRFACSSPPREVRERYNRRYRYLLIDEYQDTNRPQYELMKLLAGKHDNVCVVGDEDQSIYSWRGADIRNILEFEKDFPSAKTIRLEQNYRSTQIILEGASAVVAQQHAAQREKRSGPRAKAARSSATTKRPTAKTKRSSSPTASRNTSAKPAETERRPPRCAVLYRTNSQSRLVEEALRRYQIQYHMVGGFSFYDRAEIKDMLSYLKLVQNPHDSIALQRVVNSPARGIGKTTMETLERIALTTGISTWTPSDARREKSSCLRARSRP